MTAPLPMLARGRRRLPLGLVCMVALFVSVVASIVLVTLRTVPPSVPTPLPPAPPAATAAPAPGTSFGEGTVAVGRAIVPGTYTAPGGSSCRWARLAASGTVRASGSPRGTARVTVRASDAAVRSTGCGTWVRSGP